VWHAVVCLKYGQVKSIPVKDMLALHFNIFLFMFLNLWWCMPDWH